MSLASQANTIYRLLRASERSQRFVRTHRRPETEQTLYSARIRGKLDGIADRHHGQQLDHMTGPEIVSWLEGWREGQAALKC